PPHTTLFRSRVHPQLEARIAQRVQRAVLHVDDVLRGRVVVDHADQEGLAERQPARHRVGRVADLAPQRLALLPRVLPYQRGVVAVPRDGLLRHPGEPGDVVDGGRLSCGEAGHFRTLARWHI